jgi:hypothetical protein
MTQYTRHSGRRSPKYRQNPRRPQDFAKSACEESDRCLGALPRPIPRQHVVHNFVDARRVNSGAIRRVLSLHGDSSEGVIVPRCWRSRPTIAFCRRPNRRRTGRRRPNCPAIGKPLQFRKLEQTAARLSKLCCVRIARFGRLSVLSPSLVAGSTVLSRVWNVRAQPTKFCGPFARNHHCEAAFVHH